MGQRILDQLRAGFPYIVALGLPLAGLVLAAVRYSQGHADEGIRLVGASLVGVALYALLLTG
jgi:hypothetical protein